MKQDNHNLSNAGSCLSVAIFSFLLLTTVVIGFFLISKDRSANSNSDKSTSGSVQDVPAEVLSKGDDSDQKEAMIVVAKDQTSGDTIIKTIKPISNETISKVDYSREMLVAIFLGQYRTGGYSTHGSRVAETEKNINIIVDEISPGQNCVVTESLIQPYILLKMKRSDKTINYSININPDKSCVR